MQQALLKSTVIREVRAIYTAAPNIDPHAATFNDPQVIASHVRGLFDLDRDPQENLIAVYLTSRNQAIHIERISRGSITGAVAHPVDVARGALLNTAAAVIVLHNHPSGNPSPSAEDLVFTRKLAEALRLFDIQLHDHIVTASPDRYYSMRERGQL